MSAFIPFLLPLINALVTEILKKGWESARGKIPNWLMPILSSVLGTVIGVATGAPVEIAALAGMASPMIHDVLSPRPKSDPDIIK